MKSVLFLKNISELDQLESISQEHEIIISPKGISRLGELSIDESNQALNRCHELGFKALIEWDILMTENDFQKSRADFSQLHYHLAEAVRVQDIGAYRFLIGNGGVDIHLIIESGNHNLVAIKKWEELGGAQLKRIVLGLELPKSILTKYTQEINVPCELQVLGKILLFYSPRSLLSRPLSSSGQEKVLQVRASSEETPHKGFFVLENNHGTYMFLPKDQYLLDSYEDLLETGIKYIRLDHRFLEGRYSITDMATLIEQGNAQLWEEFKNNYTAKFIRGYFSVNKSDAIFPKLKNHRTNKKTESYIGKVVDVKKEQYLAVNIFKKTSRKLRVGDSIEISSPDGKVKRIEVRSIKNIALESISQVSNEQIILIAHVGGISVKSQVHFL